MSKGNSGKQTFHRGPLLGVAIHAVLSGKPGDRKSDERQSEQERERES